MCFAFICYFVFILILLFLFFSGNAAFGSQLLDKTKFTRTSYAMGATKVRMAVNDPLFRSMRRVETVEEMYEVSNAYRTITLNLPLYLGLNILLDSKLKMLQWHFSFLSYFIEKEHFSHIIMDTDSLYTQLCFENLEAAVKPEKKSEFMHRLKDFCGTEHHPEGMLPRTCCEKCNRFDQRVPLLMKQEYSAKLMISLCPKTYVCVHASGEGIKLSCKGVQKNLVLKSNPVQIYKTVLETGKTQASVNRGFRSINGRMYTYEALKDAFPFLYLKREVLEGNCFTRPLQNVVLDPCPVHYFSLTTEAKELTLDYDKKPVYANGYLVKTLRQAVCVVKYGFCTTSPLNPMPHSIRMFSNILRTTDAKQLAYIQKQMGDCEIYDQHLYVSLFKLVETRMNTYPELYNCLVESGHRLIVNTCPYDSVLGNGANHRESRYRKEAHLEGQNYLGKVYMTLRTRVTKVARA